MFTKGIDTLEVYFQLEIFEPKSKMEQGQSKVEGEQSNHIKDIIKEAIHGSGIDQADSDSGDKLFQEGDQYGVNTNEKTLANKNKGGDYDTNPTSDVEMAKNMFKEGVMFPPINVANNTPTESRQVAQSEALSGKKGGIETSDILNEAQNTMNT